MEEECHMVVLVLCLYLTCWNKANIYKNHIMSYVQTICEYIVLSVCLTTQIRLLMYHMTPPLWLHVQMEVCIT